MSIDAAAVDRLERSLEAGSSSPLLHLLSLFDGLSGCLRNYCRVASVTDGRSRLENLSEVRRCWPQRGSCEPGTQSRAFLERRSELGGRATVATLLDLMAISIGGRSSVLVLRDRAEVPILLLVNYIRGSAVELQRSLLQQLCDPLIVGLKLALELEQFCVETSQVSVDQLENLIRQRNFLVGVLEHLLVFLLDGLELCIGVISG